MMLWEEPQMIAVKHGWHMWSRSCLAFRNTWVHPGVSRVRGTRSLVFYEVFCRSLLSSCLFFFWQFSCTSFFDLRLLIAPLVYWQEPVVRGSLSYLFLKLVQINYIFCDNVPYYLFIKHMIVILYANIYTIYHHSFAFRDDWIKSWLSASDFSICTFFQYFKLFYLN